ncbi:hypothetical protein [Saccharopolyspora taberi]|uniref:Uncharacterized protein n=1 Tax=Saccharopolyspora taberi TaxID=60895 RepID=A0ABN3V0V0_9PSEU
MSRWIRVERLAIALLGVAVAYLIISQIVTRSEANDQADQKAAAQQQAAESAQDARAVADPLAELCRTDPSVAQRAGEACQKAAEVKRQPTAPIAVNGQDGRGIVATAIEAGRLIVSYDDGVRRDVGQVVGQPGAPGAVGAPGRGVVSTILDGVDLVAIYSDGQRENLGRIVGRDGRGITSVDGSTGRLLITFDDGTTQDAGELPRGPEGKRGPPPAGWTVQRADGSTEHCSRNAGSPDEAPTYSCTASGGPTDPPTETTTTTATETTTVTATPPPDDGGLLPIPTEGR